MSSKNTNQIIRGYTHKIIYRVTDIFNGLTAAEEIGIIDLSKMLDVHPETIRRAVRNDTLCKNRYKIEVVGQTESIRREWDTCCAELREKHGSILSRIKLVKGNY